MIVTDVADGCAASGLVAKGDNILSINGTPVTGEVQGRALARAAVGKVEFSILRGNAQVTVIADKPEATTRLGVTFKDLLTRIKDKQYLYAAKPVAVVATAEIEDDFEDVYFQDSPARGRYNQWPALCDCCSAGNCICIYGTCCTLCLAGQMYSNLFETRGKPGCCMNLCLLYTLGSICAYGSICALASAPRPGWITMAQLFGDVVLFAVSVSVCWTLIKASRLAACSFPAHYSVYLLHVPPGAPTPRPRPGHDPPLPGEQVRQELRKRSHRSGGARLSGGDCEDCLYSWYCTCCTSIQLARYLGWEDKPYNVCSPTGIHAV